MQAVNRINVTDGAEGERSLRAVAGRNEERVGAARQTEESPT